MDAILNHLYNKSIADFVLKVLSIPAIQLT